MSQNKSYLLGSGRSSKAISERKICNKIKEQKREAEQKLQEQKQDLEQDLRTHKQELVQLHEECSKLYEILDGLNENIICINEIDRRQSEKLEDLNKLLYSSLKELKQSFYSSFEGIEKQVEMLKEDWKSEKTKIELLQESKELFNEKIKKINLWMENSEKLTQEQKVFTNELLKKTQNIEKDLEELGQRLSNRLEIKMNEKENEQSAIVRELMKVKWKEIDYHATELEKADDILECLICGNKAKRGSLEVKIAECIFNGGKLERYVCSCCGAIFGPTKFSSLSQQEKDEDYYIHYLGFSENDATEKELRAFQMLNPRKEGIYLNYGCGNWSKSLQILQAEGYTVYGYEPYAVKDKNNPNLITEKSILERMRFDGIYSNDVIEHFTNPINEFNYLKTLLRDAGSKMSHSTSCYIYKHEETRFHTYFFTGDSLKYLCERTGLVSCDYVNDIEKNDFICHVFKQKDFKFDYFSFMYVIGNGEKKKNKIVLQKGSILYGPYFVFSKGSLKWEIEVEIEREIEVLLRITSQAGVKVLKETKLLQGKNKIDCQLEESEKQVELVIENNQDIEISILGIKQI